MSIQDLVQLTLNPEYNLNCFIMSRALGTLLAGLERYNNMSPAYNDTLSSKVSFSMPGEEGDVNGSIAKAKSRGASLPCPPCNRIEKNGSDIQPAKFVS